MSFYCALILYIQGLKNVWRRWYYCQENRKTSYKSVEIGAFRILKEISSIIN